MKISYPFSLSNLQISLKRGMCYGSCPVYELILLGTGEVIYRGENFVKCIGEHRSRIEATDVFKLFVFAQKIGFFHMEDAYHTDSVCMLDEQGMVRIGGGITITDVSTHVVTIQIGDTKKQVVDYYGTPRRLRRFEQMIDRVGHSERWVGTGEERTESSETHGSEFLKHIFIVNGQTLGMPQMTFKVYVDDNFHYMDESERYEKGEYESYDEAVAACKKIVDEYLVSAHKEQMTAEELYASYKSFGEDPFIVPADDKTRFSAWKYAKERCKELCGG